MKKTIYIFAAFLLFSCATEQKPVNNKVVTVSILPQKYFIEQLMGDYIEINVMIPPGASPATYEPSPKQITTISNSFAYFRIGEIIFEKVWMERFISANKTMKIYDLSRNIELHKAHEHSHDSHHHEVDPHIWMSPQKVKILIDNLSSDLQNLYPEFSDSIRNNYFKFQERIDSLDKQFQAKTKQLEQKSFIIFHPALTYLAEDYGLTQLSIELEGKEPSPVHLQEIIKKAKDLDIKTIFVQKEFNKDNAKAIAKEINAKVIEINPLGYNWEQNMLDLLEKL